MTSFNFCTLSPGSIITYPEHVFTDQPLPPEQIIDTNYMIGSAITSVSIGGSVSDIQGEQ